MFLDEAGNLMRIQNNQEAATGLCRVADGQAEVKDVFIYLSHVMDQGQRMNYKIHWLLLNLDQILGMTQQSEPCNISCSM